MRSRNIIWGSTYFDLQRWDDARAALSKALEVAGQGSTLPQMQIARARIQRYPRAAKKKKPQAKTQPTE